MQRYLDVVEKAKNLHEQGKLRDAAYLYEHLLGAQPNDAVVLYLYGTLCSQIKQYGLAITLLRAATQKAPKLSEAWHNLGVTYRNEGHAEWARSAYRKAINLEPKNGDYIAMMSGAYINTGTPEAALTWADKALEINPDNCQARNNKALALLELGRYAEAWPYYRTRYELPHLVDNKRPYTCPKWAGEATRKLAIHGEQGLGDEIMYLSCLSEVTGPAVDIVIECAPRLRRVVERTFGVPCYGTHDELIAAHPDVTAYLPIGDLPTFCRQTVDDFPGTPYLKADPALVSEYRDMLAHYGEGPYIGVAWHGGTKGTHQEIRNPPLAMWGEIRKAPATFVSLQYGEYGLDGAVELEIPHWQETIDDLDRQTALIAALDLVITPCQTAVHIAGALGVTCWCLTPSSPAWRYGMTGDRMPWYQSVRLVRQKGREWSGVMGQVAKELHDFAKLHRSEQAAA